MRIIRKRHIPEEEVDISNDEVIFHDDDIIVTKWLPIHKRQDIARGISCLFLKKGIKISKMYSPENNLVYTYCDIVKCHYKDDCLIVEDLLVDIVVYPDKTYKVLDLDELVLLAKQNKIEIKTVYEALEKLDYLLKDIYEGFSLDILEKFE